MNEYIVKMKKKIVALRADLEERSKLLNDLDMATTFIPSNDDSLDTLSVTMLTNVGFDLRTARNRLNEAINNVQLAINELDNIIHVEKEEERYEN